MSKPTRVATRDTDHSGSARGAAAPLQADPESGTIMLIVAFVAMTMFGLIYVGGIVLAAHKTRSEVEFRAVGQSRSVARAGLIDAFSWFRRQTSQPVTTFAPSRDENADPPILDTEDTSVGLVRHFQISGDIWARYEIWTAHPKHSELSVRDVSLLRGLPGLGQAWYIPSWGAVYRRVDPNAAFNQEPNQLLGSARAYTEIRRIAFSPPGEGAINVIRGDYAYLASRTRVIGGNGAGLVYPLSTGDPRTYGELSGSPSKAPVSDYDASVDAVFGVSYAQLKSLADDIITNGAEFPSPIPKDTLLIVEGDLTFNDLKPLRGTGVLVVNGNLTVDSSPKNFFNGMIYTTGSMIFRAPSVLRGTIVCNGKLRVEGTGDYAEIEYDKQVLTSLMVTIGQYRLSKAIRFLE